MSSFDSSTCVFLHVKHGFEKRCVDFLYFHDKCQQQMVAKYISGKSCNSDLRWLMYFMCRNTQVELPRSLFKQLVQFKNASVCLDKLEFYLCMKKCRKKLTVHGSSKMVVCMFGQ